MTVSIIIPTLNEAEFIERTIDLLRRQQSHQIIVVDGGSTDATLELAKSADRVLQSPPGRARQMNAGAAHATGDHVLFLHADCALEPGSLETIEGTLAHESILAGCFSMCVAARGLGFRSIDFCATMRVRLTGIAYGDQGLFLRRRDFERLGRFPELRFMEDVFFSRTLARYGKVVVVKKKIHVSPRRWRHVGIVRQTLTNWTLTALAMAGVSPDRLAEYYPRVR
jgi:rSAM/selenodomain-associated transferase 2